MAEKRLKRPRDPLALAKLIGDIATKQAEDCVAETKDASMAERGRLGGLKGGRARAKALPAKKRQKIARAAAKSRWSR